MDYKKLAGISNQLSNKAVAIVDSLQVSPDENPLDSITVEQSTSTKRIQDSKYLILDNEAVTFIMTAPRDKRRALLSKLTDSQRARVLSQWDTIKTFNKIKDGDFETKLNLMGVDTLISNYIVNPTEFNESSLKESLNSQPTEVSDFAEQVLNSIDSVTDEVRKSYSDFLQSKGIQKSAAVEALSVYAPAEEADYKPEEPLELTSEVQSEIEESADNLFSDSAKFFKSPLSSIEDGISTFVKKGYDYYQVADVFSSKLSKRLSTKVSDSSLKRVFDDVLKSLDTVDAKPFIDEQGNEVQETEDKSIITLLDEALTDYAEGNSEKLDALLTSTVAQPKEEPESESEESSDVSNEESSELLAEEDNVETSEKDETEEVKDSQDVQQLQGTTDNYQSIKYLLLDLISTVLSSEYSNETTLQEISKLASEIASKATSLLSGTEPSVEDCISLASQVKNNTVDNKLLDSFRPFLKSLSKYNLRKSDCSLQVSECSEPLAPVAEVPMTRDEYYSLSQPLVPCFFGELVSQEPKCPVVSSIEPLPNENAFLVNGTSKYTPYNVTYKSFEDLMSNTPKESLNKIIDLHCCAVEDALHYAAMTNSLSLIDNKFYKQRLSDTKWSFDEVPELLQDLTSEPGFIEYGTVEDSSKNIDIYGFGYHLT